MRTISHRNVSIATVGLALSLILVLDGMRSFRTISDGLSAADMRALIDRLLEPLRPA